jgi:hypothetical protein
MIMAIETLDEASCAQENTKGITHTILLLLQAVIHPAQQVVVRLSAAAAARHARGAAAIPGRRRAGTCV